MEGFSAAKRAKRSSVPLPRDVLLLVFRSLSVRERTKCRRVCRRWKSVVESSVPAIFSPAHGPELPARALESLKHFRLEKLSLKRFSQMDPSWLPQIAQMTLLKSLILPGPLTYRASFQQLSVLKNLHRLECLDVVVNQVEQLVSIIKALPNLRNLMFVILVPKVTAREGLKAVSNLKALRVLDIESYVPQSLLMNIISNINGPLWSCRLPLTTLVSKRFPPSFQARRLKLTMTWQSAPLPLGIDGLEDLYVIVQQHDSNDALASLFADRPPGLKSLVVDVLDSHGPRRLILDEKTCIQSLTRLETLSLNFFQVSLSAFSHLKQLRQLQLYLDYEDGIFDAIARECINLESLILGKSPEGAMDRLAHKCLKLRRLRLMHPIGDGLYDLGALTLLEELDLENLPVSDFQLSTLVRLKQLRISFSHLSSTTLDEISQLVALEKLHLWEITFKGSGSELLPLMANASHFSTLSVSEASARRLRFFSDHMTRGKVVICMDQMSDGRLRIPNLSEWSFWGYE